MTLTHRVWPLLRGLVRTVPVCPTCGRTGVVDTWCAWTSVQLVPRTRCEGHAGANAAGAVGA